MLSPTPCRLLIDPPGAGDWNMAVDETLLEWSADERGCGLRLYRWQRPTLSLGYFQPYAGRAGHAPSRDCPAVRRLTGGGAIVHDAELTYSLVVPAGHLLAARRNLLYEVVHLSLIDTLAEYRVAAELCRGPGGGPPRDEPFLCFQRRGPGDVLLGDTKIAGSAQRRRRGAVLQHGSVLLRRSAAAPELAALADVTAATLPPEELAGAWIEKMAERLGFAWDRRPLAATEQCRAAELLKTRYASARWTEERAR